MSRAAHYDTRKEAITRPAARTLSAKIEQTQTCQQLIYLLVENNHLPAKTSQSEIEEMRMHLYTLTGDNCHRLSD